MVVLISLLLELRFNKQGGGQVKSENRLKKLGF